MKLNVQKGLLGAFLLVTVAFHPSLNPNAGAQQQPAASVRQRFVILPANQLCQPAALSISLGKQPTDALLAQVTIENRSDKAIADVKLGWRVYDFREGTHVSTQFACDPQPTSAEVFLSGVTQLIQLEALAPMETGTISINPLPVPTTATKTVFIDHPLLTAEDVKSLPLDSPTPIIKYVVVMFVSEIHYADGTAWELKGN